MVPAEAWIEVSRNEEGERMYVCIYALRCQCLRFDYVNPEFPEKASVRETG